jgi:hypothetical protein
MAPRRTRAGWALTAVVCATAVAVLAAQGGIAPQTSRDAVKAPVAGRGSIAGTVVSQPASPIAHAAVAVTTADGQPVTVVYTDARGQFQAPNLAAGRYVVVATKPAYVRAPYGARRYDRPATPITLADGQQMSNLTITMARGGVLTGTVTYDGQPIPGVVVRVSQYRVVDGERTLAPVLLTGAPTSDQTDDRGTYRVAAAVGGRRHPSDDTGGHSVGAPSDPGSDRRRHESAGAPARPGDGHLRQCVLPGHNGAGECDAAHRRGR